MNRVVLTFFIAAAAMLPAGATPVTALAFSPDGAVLVSNGDRRLDLRSTKDASVQRSIVCDLPRITTLAFTPDGRWLAVGGGEPGIRGEVQLLSWPEGKLAHRLVDHADLVTGVAFDAGGRRLAVASTDHSAGIWEISETGRPVNSRRITGHAGPVLAVEFSPSGQSIVTASADRSLKVWAADDGHLIRSFSQHTEAVHTIAFRPRAANAAESAPVTCASGGDDRTVRVWQPEIGRMVRIVRQHQGPVFALAWSADGTALFSAGQEGVIRRIDAGSDIVQASWRAHDDWIYALALSPDGKVLASGDWMGAVRLHDPRRDSDVGVDSATLLAAVREPIDSARETQKPVDKPDWWSLKPLTRPEVPSVQNPKSKIQNPIDAYIVAKLAEQGLEPSPEADRRTLIRRLYFDLTGLPPTPDEIEAFLEDRDARAYERLVERLLASPRYGERWARHWLDVVHYGETHGYDKDQPRPNAWPYRDYVIRSFNEDKPYGRFVQEQLAGDVLFPGTRDGFEALGFIAAGPWDLIGHAEVPESKIDGKVARHLDRDDMVATTMQTFNSLTVQCAQCHDHKFDPIAQEDYYSLQAVFAAVDRADKKYDTDPSVGRLRKELAERQSKLAERRKKLDAGILARAGLPLTELDRKIAALAKAGKKSDAMGYHSQIEKKPDETKWVQVDLGRAVPLDAIVLHPCKDDFNGIGEGFGFPVRFKVEVSDNAAFNSGVGVLGDHTQADMPNPKLKPVKFEAAGRPARYVRVTATKLALRQNDYIFALAELSAMTAGGSNAALGAAVSALDSIEAPVRWQKVNLTDGWQPGGSLGDTNGAGAELTSLREERAQLIAQSTTADEKDALATIADDLVAVKAAQTNLPAQSTAYIAAVHTGSGSFTGTGAKGGKPRSIHLLNRGSVQKPGQEVGPGALKCLPGLPSRFELPPDHAEGERRAALARWLTRNDNPLTWRSIVNRIWQYHFGRGLVDTSNDFGRMGEQPTHPELLDWLAVEFRDGGQSLKALHRLIVTSATFRQRSVISESAFDNQSKAAHSPDAAPLKTDPLKTDSDNRYLWRQNRRKLEAEAVRDAVLFVAGKLDLTMGGPSFRDFVIEKPEHSPHYQYHLHDPEDPKSHRRSIYRFIVRSQQQPFMTVLDCADPSVQVGKRNEGMSPLQALALLNNSLMLTMSKHFAAKLEAGGGDLAAKVRRGHLEAIGRVPDADEERVLVEYAREHGLTNCCRVLLNLNEFSFVD